MNIPNWVECCTPIVWFVLYFLFWLLFGMCNCILLFFYMSPGDKNRAPQNSIEGLFLPTFIFVFLHKRIMTCVLGYYLTIRNLCPIQCSHNENDGMNAQWVLSPLSLSFSLAFSSPLSTAIVVPTLLQIPLQPFSSTHSIMGSLYIYIYIHFFFGTLLCLFAWLILYNTTIFLKHWN